MRRVLPTGLVLGLIGLAPIIPAHAQSGVSGQTSSASETGIDIANDEPAAALKAGKIIHAYRVTSPPRIDGVLDDEVWRLAPSRDDYIQRDPDNASPITQPTRIQIAYDDRFLYVAITAIDTEPDRISTGLGRRDEEPPTDRVTVAFDARHDHQTAYGFQVNPAGWQGDYQYYADENTDRDYNAVWDARTARQADGWTVEYRIPFSQMRFTASPRPGQVWGFNTFRRLRRRSEFDAWVLKPRGQRGEVSLFGHLVFDAAIPPPRRVEFVPYVLGGSTYRPDAAGERRLSTGLDARFGLGSGSTVAATLNPDFGQVEQDPGVLNLSVFETFFPERRAFFLEDSRTFMPSQSPFQLFYSRRIGRAPTRFGVAATDRIVERPAETTILGAAKLTGRRRAWTYGAITALTQAEHARVDVLAPNGGVVERRERLLEPATSYNVLRLQRDINSGTSNIGAMVTGVVRDRSSDAFAGAIDYNLRWDGNRNRVSGIWGVTRADGLGGVKSDVGGRTQFDVSHKHWSSTATFDHVGRDFRVNDLGFLRSRVNQNKVDASVSLEQPDYWHGFRRLWTEVYAERGWNDQRLVFTRNGGVNGNVQFGNFWSLGIGASRRPTVLDDLDTRGGPPILAPGGGNVYVNLSSDSRKTWQVSGGINRQHDDARGFGRGAWSNLSLQPTDRLQASTGFDYSHGLDVAQWIANQDVTSDGTIDHVYGSLRRHVLSLTFRSTFIVNRDLTVQGYLQPFVAVGAYENIRRLATPGTFDFAPASIAWNPDFNDKSVRGNVVLRWEYRPGSTLFAVWNISGSNAARPGVFDARRDLRDAFRGEASNAFVIKLSYWLNS